MANAVIVGTNVTPDRALLADSFSVCGGEKGLLLVVVREEGQEKTAATMHLAIDQNQLAEILAMYTHFAGYGAAMGLLRAVRAADDAQRHPGLLS